jgi:hypothetical protein
MDTIFDKLTIDRTAIQWENYLYELTPVEQYDKLWFKREDKFAPLGYGGINGSKLRQLIYLFNDYCNNKVPTGVITGASVLSPQISMSALVAKHYGLPITVVVGATAPHTAIKHENVAIAVEAGAKFEYIKVAYNPALQRAVKELQKEPEHERDYRLCYGITTPEEAGAAGIEAFHRVGAHQVANIPPEVTTLAIPAGSCNSVTSVLYGLALYPNNVKRIILFGIGPTRLDWIHYRLGQIEEVTGLNLNERYNRIYHHHRDLEDLHQTAGAITIEHYDLHTTKYATYQDKMPYYRDGISFHPTYEGKMMTYIQQHPLLFPEFIDPDGTQMVWIVGSNPTRYAMAETL